MRRFFHSLAIKVGGLIIITQIVILALVGYVYVNRFSAEVDEHVEEQVQIPGILMNAGLLNLDSIADTEVMGEILGEELVEGLVVGVNYNVFFASKPDYLGQDVRQISHIDGDLFDISIRQSRIKREKIDDDNFIVSITPILQSDQRTPRFLVYVKISTNEAEEDKASLTQAFVIGSTASIIFTSLVIFLAFNVTIFARLRSLLEVLRRIEQGELNARVAVLDSMDEIGMLQRGVNAMTIERERAENALKELNEELEQRVATRTRDLNIAADVSRQITTILDTSQLLKQVVEHTQAGFGLYHVSVYVYDYKERLLKLREVAGQGIEFTAHEYQVSIGQNNAVSQAGGTRQPVLINDVRQSIGFLPNPYLPDTRAELAIPMVIGKRLLGVLDLRATEVGHFTNDDVKVLTTLAEQIAIALQNSRLFSEAKQARELAEQANKVKSQFLASMSHELRTPLNAILNFSKFISFGMFGEVTDEQVKMLDKITESGDHLLQLVNDILDISKIEAGALMLFVEDGIDLEEEANSVLEAAKGLIGQKAIELRLEVENSLPVIRGDKRRVRQIMLNLVSNACKFTEQGSVNLKLYRRKSDVVIEVADTGPGIDPRDHELIFEKFRQAKTGIRQGEGTGLGLAITRSLAAAHDGQLWLESVVGEGTTFYVRLPINAPSGQSVSVIERSEGLRGI